MDIVVDFLENKKIGVAVSGGMDSMALLHWFLQNRQRLNIELIAINFDHGLRESSPQDSKFVMDYCQKNNIPCLFYKLDLKNTPCKNIENAARLARYQIFHNLLKQKRADFIATAHHANDNAETVLLHLFRGSGLKGVSGIRYKTPEGITRPLLYTSKEDIQKYIQDNNIPYVTDETNLKSDFDRNYIRLEILPKIIERFFAAVKNISAFSKNAKADNEFINQYVPVLQEKNGEIFIPLEDFDQLPSIINRQILNALYALDVKYDIEQKHIEMIKTLKDKKTGSRYDIKKQVVAIRDYDGVTLTRPNHQNLENFNAPFGIGKIKLPTGLVEIALLGQAPNLNFLKNLDELYVDAEKLPQGCVIRYRRAGDFINKLGGGGRESLKEFFIDRKILARRRNLTPIIAKDNIVYAILGLTISEDVKITSKTQKIYKLTYSEDC
ncbi:MAG TPA: tRNA lysidine(34) synthetase TilS [Clostridiales bacterium]|nr:tRNA lysidine(34) synthetase TilS [Clostridiales bacterium]